MILCVCVPLKARVLVTFVVSLFLLTFAAPAAAAPGVSSTLVFAAENGGAWSLFVTDTNTGNAARISVAATNIREPAVSPDGRTIAFRSKRDGLWDIYASSSAGGAVNKLTRGMTYSGAPTWSPDGTRLAFESYARGDLDIWTMNADGAQPADLTDDSKAQDYGPAWSPDGKWIAFTSWRTGSQQIFIVSGEANCTGATCKRAFNLSQSKFDDSEPAWSPDGKQIAFVSDRDNQRAIYTADFSILGLSNIKRVTFSGWDDRPAWSPDGQWLAFISARPTRQPAYIVPANGSGIPHALNEGEVYVESVSWSREAITPIVVAAVPLNNAGSATPLNNAGSATPLNGAGSATPLNNAGSTTPPSSAGATIPLNGAGSTTSLNGAGSSTDSAPTLLYQAKPDLAAPNSGKPYEMRRITSTRVDPGINKLNGRVADSWLALQARLKQEVGYDFMGVLAEMVRPVDYVCDNTCDSLSWHKSGRAFDSRLDYTDARGSALELIREDEQGETFFRMLLRTSAQDGTMGEPVKEAPWDLGYRARWVIAPGEGGVKKPVPYGFYLDFTELAREYGWERISANDDEDFGWRTNKVASEYWHYQRTDGLNWYQAMREVFTESDLKGFAEWNAAAKMGYDAYLLVLKGIPQPARAWRWNVLEP